MSDGYDQTLNQVEREKQARQNGSGYRPPSLGPKNIAEVQAGEVTDLGVEPQYYPGALRAAAAAAVLTRAIAATIEVQFGGEEGLEPQTA